MFVLIQAHEYGKYSKLIDQMLRLRKKIFFDKLNWDVSVFGDIERDRYDDLKPAYLVWTDEKQKVLYGSLRLMPTTGPTLLNDVFRKTFSENLDLCNPAIWEGTRMCVDVGEIAQDYPGMLTQDAMSWMLLGVGECALAHGIHTLISNYEPHMKRIYQHSGAELDEIGRHDGYGKRPVCCGVFDVTKKVVENMRLKNGQTKAAYRRPMANVTSNVIEFLRDRNIRETPYGIAV
jgi:N-acyl-L-homoserine lactone synthetase